MEGLNLAASLIEMRAITGGKIDKIQQPQREVVILTVHTDTGNHRLLLSAIPDSARAQLTDKKYENPIDAPAFCMLLRRRIMGGRVVEISQPHLDRILLIKIQARNDIGDDALYTLSVELMGRYSNIILLDENNRIIDSVRRVGADMSSVRQIAPGLIYKFPPAQEKIDPLLASKEDFRRALLSDKMLGAALVNAFFGLSPDMAKALAARVTDKKECAQLSESERETLAKSLMDFYEGLGRGEASPCLLLNEYNEPIRIYPFALSVNNIKTVSGMKAGLDELYSVRDVRAQMYRMSASYRKIIKNNIERCERKMSMFAEVLNSGAEINNLKLYGELLTANIHILKQGASSAAVMNYYSDPPVKLSIPLDASISPVDNAQRYYKQYRKARTAYDSAESQSEETMSELMYLEGMLCDLDNVASSGELLDIRDELLAGGYLKRQKKAEKTRTRAVTQPLRFLSGDKTLIYVGKNNKQNDKLTFSIADPEDIWLHIKNAPGSHVIIKSRAPSKQTLWEAAMLAAYYSSQRGGANIAIDYTQRKNVKKPSGAKPGMVIYLKNNTVFVTPDEAFVKSLTKHE